ncbi:hypothetical protein BH713_13460 [Enterobacter kobei]|uniref:Uncharacterized protein n=1 Tax=Enterobacter kobei TaxID=208224 RepID=A0ACC8SDJ9_9ENTR|nr:hypothetical protein BH713_13460 [Enterobacter kobei]
MRDDNKFDGLMAVVPGLMFCPRRDFNSLPGLDFMFITFHFHRQGTLKDIKKLSGNRVKVSLFVRTWRHFFVNNEHVLPV